MKNQNYTGQTKKLVILDYSKNQVHIFNTEDINIDDTYVENLGFNTNQCYYIYGNIDILEHLGILL